VAEHRHQHRVLTNHDDNKDICSMRNAHVIAAAILISIPSAAAAQAPERQSAIGTDLRDYGGFVGLEGRFGDMGGAFGGFAGGHAALLLKQTVYLGLSGVALVSEEPGVDMAYGGLLAGYVVPTSALVQVTVEALLAGGAVRPSNPVSASDEDWDDLLVFEPTMGIELKLAPVLRLGFGVSYRFAGGSNTPGIDDGDLRGFNGSIVVRAGWF
jgi:hypothetical protein